MKRRKTSKIFGYGILAVMVTSLAIFVVQDLWAKTKHQPPNILFCISDDQSWLHTSIGGCKAVQTPGFDRVAREGILFNQAFCAAPACGPSRASILTGQYIWRLKEAGSHGSDFPAEFMVYPDILENAGYKVGYTGKGGESGSKERSGRTRNPAGPVYSHYKNRAPLNISYTDYYANFNAFLKEKKAGQPFCFWYGGLEPHRGYKKGIGLESGKNPEDVVVPGFLPDTPEVRSDLLDYFVEIEWFDSHLCRMLDILEEQGELENTIVVVTSDNGMPFPKAKSNLYEYGTRMPLAIMWPSRIKKGRTVDDLVSLTDLASTYLEAAGIPIPEEMTGKSLMPIFLSNESGIIDDSRTAVYTARERHGWTQKNGEVYAMRAIRTHEYLFIRNYKPHLYPAGSPDYRYNFGLIPFGDANGSPTSKQILQNRDTEQGAFYYNICYERRPAEELYNLKDDPFQTNNLIDNPDYSDAKDVIRQTLDDYLRQTGDPRALGNAEVFENAWFYGPHGIETEGMDYRTWLRKERDKAILISASSSISPDMETNPDSETDPDMIHVKGGTFQMGDSFDDGDADIDEVNVHTVNVGSFFMSKYEITQKEFEALLGYNSSYFKGDKLPVTNLNWLEAMHFCNKMSEAEDLTPCYNIDGWDYTTCDFDADGYRLPTEAEWEYAAKGGIKTEGFKYAGDSDLDMVGWYLKNTDAEPQPVGGKKPNELGLHDMSGNVSEWCWDAYGEDYYQHSPINDPTGPEFKGKPVFRGGSWINNPWNVRTTTRLTGWASSAPSYLGFRVVRNANRVKETGDMQENEKMLTVESINQTSTDWINVKRITQVSGRPVKMKLKGELGFRASRNIRRIKEELPYAEEYILGQISGEKGLWSNFARFHGDIAGRYILAMTYAESNNSKPPGYLKDLVDKAIALQNEDGSFGAIQYEENPLNMHKAYGNGWMLKAISQYAITFQQKEAEKAAVKLGDFYIRTYKDWETGPANERRNDGNYAVSRSGFFHGFDGLMTLYRLTNDKKYFELSEKFVPLLTPLNEADHAHMYLTSRRGLLEYYSLINDTLSIISLTDELKTVYETFIFETGGVPERFVQDEEKRNDPQRHGDDEACGLFDWEILTMRMFEVTGDHDWMEHAILNLENAIYYNQTHNYGFGACSMGSVYKERRKEAPWCCTLFGPYGLLESASCWVEKKSGILEINHLVSGEFEFEGEEQAILTTDNEKGIFRIELKNRAEIESVSLHVPHWLKPEVVSASVENNRLKLEVPPSGVLEIPYSYRVWMSGSRTSPHKRDSFKDGETGVLFYGPWLLAHHFPNDIQTAKLQLDNEGFITNFSKEYIRGINIYGESTRIIIPSDIEINPNDVARGIDEKSGELYLYPLRDRESVWHSATELRFRNL